MKPTFGKKQTVEPGGEPVQKVLLSIEDNAALLGRQPVEIQRLHTLGFLEGEFVDGELVNRRGDLEAFLDSNSVNDAIMPSGVMEINGRIQSQIQNELGGMASEEFSDAEIRSRLRAAYPDHETLQSGDITIELDAPPVEMIDLLSGEIQRSGGRTLAETFVADLLVRGAGRAIRERFGQTTFRDNTELLYSNRETFDFITTEAVRFVAAQTITSRSFIRTVPGDSVEELVQPALEETKFSQREVQARILFTISLNDLTTSRQRDLGTKRAFGDESLLFNSLSTSADRRVRELLADGGKPSPASIKSFADRLRIR